MSDKIRSYVKDAQEEFSRTVECKHTAFDDLYPYMVENQSFFWYKRHAAWASLLTIIKAAEGLDIEWQDLFTAKQIEMIEKKVLDKQVLDGWLEASQTENSK